jgi:hypothetical protein
MASNSKNRNMADNPKLDEYLRAVGAFVTYFAIAENYVHKVLWKFAGVTPIIATCIFSGTRIDGAISYLKRIAEATDWPENKKTLLNYIALQLGEITQLRNDLLHFGASGDPEETLIVTNKKFAHIESRIRETKISASILKDVRRDLLMILFLLGEVADEHEWQKYPGPTQHLASKGLMPDALVKIPWQYKPERRGHQAQTPPVRPPRHKHQPQS